MNLQPTQALSQKLVLSPSMHQSFELLQLPIISLQSYIQEIALGNPVIEIIPSNTISAVNHGQTIEYREHSFWYTPMSHEETDALSLLAYRETFSEYLYSQIGQSYLIDDNLRPLCMFLVDCLDRRGYLDCPLDSLAMECGCDQTLMEQALYAIQMLDPPGVGARDLAECLVLQLIQSEYFNELTLHIVKDGLESLAENNYATLARRFNVTEAEVEQSARAIRSFNPIPSRGFSGGEDVSYSVPEAEIILEEDTLVVSMNKQFLPEICISDEYRQMLQETNDKEVRQYLRRKFSEADTLVENFRHRSNTLTSIFSALVSAQQSFFLEGIMQPLTMQQLATQLGLNTSTVSRAVQDKTIQYEGRIIPLRNLFTSPIYSSNGSVISAQAIKKQLQSLIKKEDSDAPLSDDMLCKALKAKGINISRRTVAKYRSELGYDIASHRKAKKT